MSNEHSRISQHETLNGTLIVDWNKDYHQDFRCPKCNSDQLTIRNDNSLSEKCYFICKNCQNKIKLFYQNSPHIFRYEKSLSCPNPECTQLSPDGKTKGWIYLQSREVNGIRYKCHYCKTRFFINKEANKPKKPT
jgi:predicted SprT family Zn-dependent metalloprotease